MLSWDLLGISSFFLVLFYNNWDSSSGSMNTVMTNRFGDFFMFMLFSFFVFNFNIFNYYFMLFLFILFLLFISFTKSAQFPFSGWLPKAMSAPTPVSALVHSSTLVTAGLILLFMFNFYLNLMFNLLILLVFGFFTMGFSSMLSLYEKDFKKIVALSTLSQMGFCVFIVGLSFIFLSFIHLLSHAFFKSCLFMQVGFMIFYYFGQQDFRYFFMFLKYLLLIQFQFFYCLFCLCGLFFSNGFMSKDFVLEYFFFDNYYFYF